MKYLFLVTLLPIQVFASSFTLMAKTGNDTSWFKITQKNKAWICETKHFPFYEAKENPLANMNWSELKKESAVRPKNCKTTIALENDLLKKKESIVTCGEQKHTLELYQRIHDLCRAKI